jgi:hypothetical protein
MIALQIKGVLCQGELKAVPDLRLNELDERQRPTGRGAAGRRSSARFGWDADRARAAARKAAAIAGPRALWRDHRLFTILVVASLVPRVLATEAFRPALLSSDSFWYMRDAATGNLDQIRPSGYSFFLSLMHVFPAPLLAVTTVQHLMGIVIAAIAYGLLRYWGLPAWGAVLLTIPVLLDSRQIALESYILPDTLYCLAIMVVVALLITKSTPRLWQCALAALLLAYVTVLRGNGFPIALVTVAYLLIRRVGWRAVTAGVAAFVVPVLWYVVSFHAAYGQYNITSSDGLFLWSRTTTFANCAIIKPPPNLVPLCPDKAILPPAKVPVASTPVLVKGPAPANYLWAPDAWWRHDAHPGFNAYNDNLGMQFALDAIKAQPFAYLRASAKDAMQLLLTNDRPQNTDAMAFTRTPRVPVLPATFAQDITRYTGAVSNTHPVQPYAYFMYIYQLPVYFPGVAFFAVLAAGLVGIVRKWRQWGGPAALPWVLAVLSIVLPALLTQSFYRYDLAAVPLACVAAGLAFIRPRRQPSRAAAAPARPAPVSGERSGQPDRH